MSTSAIDKMIQDAANAQNTQAAQSTNKPAGPAGPKPKVVFEMIDTQYTFEEYQEVGHTEESLVAEGLARYVEVADKPAGPSGPKGPVKTAVAQHVQAQVNQVAAYQAPTTLTAGNVPADVAAMAVPMTMSMENLLAQGVSADNWVKTGFHGLSIDEVLVNDFKAVINMTERMGFQPCQSIRFGEQPNVQYDSTVDGVTAKSGKTWPVAIMQARAIDPKCRPYRSVTLTMTALEDITACKGGKVVVPAGTIIGYATSVTGWANWEKFYKACVLSQRLNGDVFVNVGCDSRKKGSSEWGVMCWDIIVDPAIADDETEILDGQTEVTGQEAADAEAVLAKKK